MLSSLRPGIPADPLEPAAGWLAFLEGDMPGTNWRLKGDWIKNCNCAFGCPCDFNARPTHGTCKGLLGMRIEQGHFGDTTLDGLSFFVVVDFPGPAARRQRHHSADRRPARHAGAA